MYVYVPMRLLFQCHSASSSSAPLVLTSLLVVLRSAPSSVVKCLWEVFVWGFGVLFLSCVCVCVGGVVLCSLSVCVCV